MECVTKGPILFGLKGSNAQEHTRLAHREASIMDNASDNYEPTVKDENITDDEMEQEMFLIDEDFGSESSDDPDFRPQLKVNMSLLREPTTRRSLRKNRM